MNGGVTVHMRMIYWLVMLSDLFTHPWVGICLARVSNNCPSFSIAGPRTGLSISIELNRVACHRPPDSDLVAYVWPFPANRARVGGTFVFLG